MWNILRTLFLVGTPRCTGSRCARTLSSLGRCTRSGSSFGCPLAFRLRFGSNGRRNCGSCNGTGNLRGCDTCDLMHCFSSSRMWGVGVHFHSLFNFAGTSRCHLFLLFFHLFLGFLLHQCFLSELSHAFLHFEQLLFQHFQFLITLLVRVRIVFTCIRLTGRRRVRLLTLIRRNVVYRLIRYISQAHLKHILQFATHCDDIVIWRVILVAIGKYKPNIGSKFVRRLVFPIIHFSLHRAQIHWLLDNIMIVMQTEQFRVHRFVERPRVTRVLLGKQLFQNFIARFKRIRKLLFVLRWILSSARALIWRNWIRRCREWWDFLSS